MGKNRDVYIAHKKASDSYCGRILQGLPEYSPEFAVSYPDFVPLDLEQSLQDGILETVLAEWQQVVDSEVNAALNAIFGIENLNAFPSIRHYYECGWPPTSSILTAIAIQYTAQIHSLSSQPTQY
jgi:hypothetical protein